MYAGVEFHPLPEPVKDALSIHPKMKKFLDVPGEDLALSTRILTRRGCTRILRRAFEYASSHRRRSVTLVEKPNVLRETGGFILDIARRLAPEFPDVEFWEANVDAMAMWLVKNPQDYAVLVAENLFGDIISDLAAQLVGGLGFACSGNIGDHYAVFEPTHGSAPKYTGMNKVNPTAMLLAVKMMFDWLGERDSALRLENAVAEVIMEGKVRTYDMGGAATTLDMAHAVAARLE
jgi:3-isopropylmalate dehydrogenase